MLRAAVEVFARPALAAVLAAALAGIALAEADLAAYGIGGSGSAEPEW